jgi:hypothetical protein
MEEGGYHLRVGLLAIIDGLVYLSISYHKDTQSFELYLSLCLETSEMSKLFKDAYRYNEKAHPYAMAWPPSLLQSKASPCLCVKCSPGVLFIDCMHLI